MTWESEGERSNRRGIMAGQSTLVSHLLSAISRTASHTLIILNGEDKMTHSDWIHQLRRHPARWLTQGGITTLFYTLKGFKSVRLFLSVKVHGRSLFDLRVWLSVIPWRRSSSASSGAGGGSTWIHNPRRYYECIWALPIHDPAPVII